MQHSESNTRENGNPSADGLTQAGQGRRTFLEASAAALIAGVAIQFMGCSTDEGNEPNSDGSMTADKIQPNHAAPHKAIITKEQLNSGGSVTLDIQGDSDHSHTVVFSADQVATIKAREHAMTASTSTTPPGGVSHSHVVMFN